MQIIRSSGFALCLTLATAAAALADECRTDRFRPTFVRHDSVAPTVFYVEPGGSFTMMLTPEQAQQTCRERGVRQLIDNQSCQRRNWGDFGCGCNITTSPNRTCANFRTFLSAFNGNPLLRYCTELFARADWAFRQGRAARIRGDAVQARALLEQALAQSREGVADPRCGGNRSLLVNLGSAVERELAMLPAPVVPPPVRPVAGGNILGAWRGCDGRVIVFRQEGDVIVGRYTVLGGLGRFGFSLNEESHRLQLRPDGRYVGQVKWRWTNGRIEWKPTTIEVRGATYNDPSADSCSRTMQSVR